MGILRLFWNLLGIPVKLVANLAGLNLSPAVDMILRGVLALLVAFILYRILLSVLRSIRSAFKHDTLADKADIDALLARDSQFQDKVLAARTIENTAAELKKARDYVRLAEVYAGGARHKEAAKWFLKAGKRRESAQEWAKAGNPVKAAKLYMKEGDFVAAGALFAEKGRLIPAAKAYEKAGALALAADCYVRANKHAMAARAYADYFATAREDLKAQLAAADACARMLQSESARRAIPEDLRKSLLAPVAMRFEQAKRYDVAGALYREAGDLVRAGESLVLAGRFEEAAACMREAGRPKDAARIAGRFYESHQKWKEAATSYVQAGEFLQAAECYTKAADMISAAECFEKAGDLYRAAVAYARGARYEEAIRQLQHLKEDSPSFEQSRGLLGRCFYELHDYAHCAAALDNHLLGKRVSSSNADFFYMLALAKEQLGKLDESRELLYKIRTVDVGYRDVTNRIANISGRISMQSELGGVGPASAHAGAPTGGQGAQAVQSAIGTRYQIQRELGRGGMGVVYLAKDTQLDRPVALKFLGTLVDDSEEYRQRFIREARTAARISHPNIISIYDISASVGRAYIAMEYIEGPSLHRYLDTKGKLTPREAINIIEQACAALAAIHQAGIVHRDIKPDNILLAKGGLVKVMDFGLAKAEDTRMTRTGVIMGTPSYMAPEQVLGKEADARSDVYSLGLVLHECLTGKIVFGGDGVFERQLKEIPPPPSAQAEGVSPELDQIVLKSVAKPPEARFQSAQELLAALRKLH